MSNVATREQREALRRLWLRGNPDPGFPSKSYRRFRKEDCQWGFFNDPVIMVNFMNMVVGVEPDGYTHS